MICRKLCLAMLMAVLLTGAVGADYPGSELVTGSVDNINSTSATFNGDLQSLGDFDQVYLRFRYRMKGLEDPVTVKNEAHNNYVYETLADNGVLYSGDSGGVVYAYDVIEGSVLWSHSLNSGSIQTLALDEGVLYSGQSYEGLVVAYDVDNEQELWSVNQHNYRVYSLGASDNLVFVGGTTDFGSSENPEVVALDKSGGSEVWSYSPHGDNIIHTLTYEDGVLYSGANDGRVVAYDVDTQQELWSHDLHTDSIRDIMVRDDTVYSFGSGSQFVAFDASTESELWNETLDIGNSAALEDQVLYAGDSDGIMAYNISSRTELWSSSLNGDGISVEEGVVYSADGERAIGLDNWIWSQGPQESSSPTQYSKDVTGLQANKDYEFQAFVQGFNSSGGFFSENAATVEFSTTSLDLGGSGTESDPYPVSTCEDLELMDNDREGHFELSGNIDCSDSVNWRSGSGFKPVGVETGDKELGFRGSLDGNGYFIKDLYIEESVEEKAGLFDTLIDAEVHDLGFTGSEIIGQDNIGVLAGIVENSSIERVYVSDLNVTGTGFSNHGGVIGDLDENSTMNSIYSSGTIDANEYSGGIVARSAGNITNSFSTVDISSAGGVGGLVGYNLGDVAKSYSTGEVSGSWSVGGLVGSSSGSVVDSYWDTETSGQSSSAGGTGLTTSEMMGQAGGSNMNIDFQNNWTTQSFYYPRLQWLEPGSGTEADPYRVFGCKELQALRNNLTANYELANDIDCSDTENWDSGNGFEPVGPDYQNPFTGTLNGQSFTVDRLFIDRGSSLNVGLIGYLGGGALVESITVADADLSGDNNAGILVGRANDADINSASSSGNISAASNIGGLVGYLSQSNINSSYSTGDVDASGAAGGLVGNMYLSHVHSGFSTGDVSGGDKVGGLVGTAFDDNNVSSSFSGSNVSGGNYVGGLLGENNGEVESSFSYGGVTGSSNVGGLLGYSAGGVVDGYWDTESSGQTTSDGGSGLTTSEMQGCDIEGNLQGFDFENTWSAREYDYPALRFFVSGDISCGVSPPSPPTLLLPIDGSNQVPVTTNLSVTAEGTGLQNITFYQNKSGSDSEIGSVIDVNASNSEIARVEWSGLNTTESYDWYAISENSGGTATSNTWNFTTEEKPGILNFSPGHEADTAPNPQLEVNVSDDISNDIEVRFYDADDQVLKTVSGLQSGEKAVYDPSGDQFGSSTGETYGWYAMVETDSGAVLNSSQAPGFEDYWNFTTQNIVDADVDVKFGDQVNMNNGSADIGVQELRFKPWNDELAVMDNVTVDVDGNTEIFTNVASNSTLTVDISSMNLDQDASYIWSISIMDEGLEIESFNGEFTTHTVTLEAVPKDGSHDEISFYYSPDGSSFTLLKSFEADSSPLQIQAANPELFQSDSHCYTAATSRLGLESSKSPEQCVGGSMP